MHYPNNGKKTHVKKPSLYLENSVLNIIGIVQNVAVPYTARSHPTGLHIGAAQAVKLGQGSPLADSEFKKGVGVLM